MTSKIVVGAGSTGILTALRLADDGEQVRLITRRGSGPEHPNIELIAADANNVELLAELTQGAGTLFNAAMPPYDRWPQEWPHLAASLLTAAERAGADYVMLGNLYGYGPVAGPLTSSLPLAATTRKGRVRAKMWQDALAAHNQGRVRVTEVRASDFLGPAAISLFTMTVLPAVLASESATYLGDLEAMHPWTYTGDAARTMIAASTSEQAWGRAWHVPSTSHASPRDLTDRLLKIAGTRPAGLEAMTPEQFDQLASGNSIMEEVREMLYCFSAPLLLEATETEQLLGISATPLDDVLTELVTSHRQLPPG